MTELKKTKTPKRLRELADYVIRFLTARYPKPDTLLNATTPWEWLVATMLSAQCTDLRVNKTLPEFFAAFPTVKDAAAAPQKQVEDIIQPVGLYRNKAANIIAAAQVIVECFHERVPDSKKDLTALPGVGSKTANVVLWAAFGKNEGIAVDTHVARISHRLGLTGNTNPDKIERDLTAVFSQDDWGLLNHCMVWFGREVCKAAKPLCFDCGMSSRCAFYRGRAET